MTERENLSCLEIEPLLAEFVEGGLAGPQRVTVERHAASCATCRELVESATEALALCRDAGPVVAPPRLVPRILEQTSGKLTWQQRLRIWLRPAMEPRLALGVMMALISFSIVLNAFDVDVSSVSMADLNPLRIYRQADRKARLAGARVVKFYSDLRIVYEIQTQLQTIRETSSPREEPAREPQKQETPQQRPQAPAQNKWSRQPVYVAWASF